MQIFEESQKVSDIIAANLVNLPTRTVKLASGQQGLVPGAVMVAGSDNVFHLITVADGTTQPQVGILGEHVQTGAPPINPAITVAGALFFGGEFVETRLIVTEETPAVDLFAIREYLLLHNLYLASAGVGQ
jgi:hypothetical protein